MVINYYKVLDVNIVFELCINIICMGIAFIKNWFSLVKLEVGNVDCFLPLIRIIEVEYCGAAV